MGDRSKDNEDNEEYNGIEMDDVYDPNADYSWDGSVHDTSKDNTWDPSATVGDVRPEDETKEQRKAREKAERKAEWAKVLREAEAEAKQKAQKKREVERRARELRKQRADEARKEAEKRGYKIEDWEVERAANDSPAAKKERKVATVLVVVGLVAGGLGGVIGHAAAPDAEVVVEKDVRYVDNTPSLETLANNRATEIIAERGLTDGDPDKLNSCREAASRGLEMRNYYLRSQDTGSEVTGYIRTLYALSMDHDIDQQELNDARVGLRALSNREYGATERAQRMIRDLNYYAQECGLETDSEFSDDIDAEVDLSYLEEADAEFERTLDPTEFEDIDETGIYTGGN